MSNDGPGFYADRNNSAPRSNSSGSFGTSPEFGNGSIAGNAQPRRSTIGGSFPNGGDGSSDAGVQQFPRIAVNVQDAFMTDPEAAFQLNGDGLRGADLSQASKFDIVAEAKAVIRTFLQEHQCYELIKNSGKVEASSYLSVSLALVNNVLLISRSSCSMSRSPSIWRSSRLWSMVRPSSLRLGDFASL